MSTSPDNIAGPSSPAGTSQASARVKRKAPRSRSGCLVCRSRRIRCDETHPECARCIKYGAECVYPTKKPFDAVKTQETLRKRHQPTVQAPTSTSPKTPLRVYDDAPTSLDGLMALCRMTKMGSFFSNPDETPPEFLKAAFADQDEMMCFHHCLTYTLSILVIREDNNPWIKHVLPIFIFPDGTAPLSTEALRYTILTIGATHLSYLHTRVRTQAQDEHYRSLSRTYRSKAVRLLRQARCQASELESDAFFAAALAMATNDVFAAETTWREVWNMCTTSVQAKGGCEELLFGKDGNGVPSERHRLLVEHLCLSDMMMTLSSGLPLRIMTTCSGWFERMGQIAASGEDLESFEITKGIQRRLFRLTCETSSLIAARITLDRMGDSLDPTLMLHQYQTDIARLSASLESWKMEYPTMKMDLRTQIGSLAYWHASHILLKKELCGMHLEDAAIQSSAKAILDLCVETGDKIEFLNWPLIIASSTLIDSALRERARSIIGMFAYQCCKEIERLSSLVEEIWRRMDEGGQLGFCAWIEVLVELGIPVLLG